MHVTVQQLAALVQGQVHGDGGLVIHAARPMSEAGPHDLTFIEKLKGSKPGEPVPEFGDGKTPNRAPDGREGFAAVERFRAAIFEAQHRRYLQREYEEEWYRVPRAGRFLRDLWREGQKYPVDELARYMGYDGLDLRPLTEELLAGVR